ncbi:peptidylprolyl isomerase [Bartonella vinsonii]|uniref:Peptidyl-prolyl cis-trans isomerase n=1 Tax=Bartonella vinsonii subsp. berkhoffii str. Tweed TaxID=1094502 RepID=N6VMH8_BARVB|nr:peptidylprolyl isomerase [Bartonella vinsonii]AGF75991.1 peptidyl-prolyl cis-trans isomerase B, cyclophilin type [Bartonella vinsonii subsp. berkhoffii str. Winnie]ENN95060.1 peptidyl-prolyl cis-trans isomerase B, cyclophilin type [Bartonella vinsonii subsp. berkhoffii str. Tweed]
MYLRFFAVLTCLFCFFSLNAIADVSHTAGDSDILVLSLKNGDVVIRLRPDLAPRHVVQIKKLTKGGAYNNVVFHRVIPGFMAQTGDVQFGKKGSADFDVKRVGTGASNYPNIPAEFSKQPFKRGTVGMARAQDPNSANSQFFICFDDASFLNGQYTVVGEVIKGMDVVDKIKKGTSSNNGSVKDPDVINTATLQADK